MHHYCKSRNMQVALLLVSLFILSASSALQAAALNLVYERIVYDFSGNEIGVERQTINSYEDLPLGNPWRSYLTQLVGTRTLLSYAQEISKSLSQPLNMTISDRDQVSASSKTANGFNLNLYKHVTQYSTEASKKFIFLHELGHVAMLNGYPSTYNFSGLDYGPDGTHYMDEILPNAKTAWIEGWANAFAASKNNGAVFNLDMKSSSIVAFLKNNTFEEMTRNELFTAKVTYDLFNSSTSGQSKSFNAISRTGPHNSLLDFCRGYLSLYPQDQVTLAKILDKDSQGKISQYELLAYVNGGSSTVSSALGSYLSSRSGSSFASTNTTSGSSSSGGFWSSLGSFFSRLFGGIFGNQTGVAATPATPPAEPTALEARLNQGQNDAGQSALPPGISASQGIEQISVDAPSAPSGSIENQTPGITGDLAAAQEAYLQAFAVYNDTVAKYSNDSSVVKKALEALRSAKSRVILLRRNLNTH
ncbi:MAG: hypothetical protein WA705_23670 [Candidatus Ozemobacteraceae bacterium]